MRRTFDAFSSARCGRRRPAGRRNSPLARVNRSASGGDGNHWWHSRANATRRSRANANCSEISAHFDLRTDARTLRRLHANPNSTVVEGAPSISADRTCGGRDTAHLPTYRKLSTSITAPQTVCSEPSPLRSDGDSPPEDAAAKQEMRALSLSVGLNVDLCLGKQLFRQQTTAFIYNSSRPVHPSRNRLYLAQLAR